MKLTKEEKETEALHQGNALTLKKPDQALLKQLRRAAENTFKKDRRINIRLSDHDIVAIQRVAAAKGGALSTIYFRTHPSICRRGLTGKP